MPQVLSQPPKPFSWSFSHVDNFHTCGFKYYRQVVKKDVSDTTVYRTEGNEVHSLMENRLVLLRPLPVHLQHWDRWVEELLEDCDRTTTILRGEQKLAFTEDFEPCEYFSKSQKVWCRVVIDAIKKRGDKAWIRDWKTGRMKPNEDQLLLYATAVFIHWPEVKEIDAGLVFLKEDIGPHIPRSDCIYELRITRADLKPFWSRYIRKVQALQLALASGNFPQVPSGLCKNHCAVADCPHNGHYAG